MNTGTAHYRLRQKIKDDKFSIEQLEYYNLLLQAGEREFQLIVVDSKSHRCLLLEHYDLVGAENEDSYLDTLENLFKDHHLLMAGFWHGVKLSVKNRKFSLVPASLFDKDKLASYLDLNSRTFKQRDRLLYYKHVRNSAVTVFAANARLIDWLNNRYPNLGIQVIHHTSALTEGLLNYDDLSSQKDVFLLVEGETLSITVTNDRKLQYCNMFHCSGEKEFVRYVLLVFQQLTLDRANTKTLIWGDIGMRSPWFRAIHPYIKNLSFGRKPRFINFGFPFDEIEDHRFFDLYSLYVCE